MSQYIARRVLAMFAVLFVTSLITFTFMHLVPGNPFDRERAVPPQVIAALEAKYNLNDPVYLQYANYMIDILVPRITGRNIEVDVITGLYSDYLFNIDIPGTDRSFRWMDFGPSYRASNRTVNGIFKDHLPVSFQLGIAAMVIAMVIGIPAGTAAALNRNSTIDYLSMGISLIGVSIPAIVSGPILRYLFGVQLRWLPPTGWGTLEQMILPAISLGFASSALLARLTRASLLQVLNEDYIRTARAKGLPERTVISLHALKNSMIPVVTILGPMFAGLTTGTFVVELIFGIPGMGQFFVTSISNRDYPIIMGTTLLYASFLVIANLIVDLTYAMLDPRITYS
jgi:ABC-type dipeptide/oligopeptide/nickel transport system permease component